MLKHCAELVCIKPFSFKVEGQRGRPINVKQGDLFWNTTPSHTFERTGQAKLARKGRNLADAYCFTMAMIEEYFAVAS